MTDVRGGDVTVTPKLHDAVWRFASTALHVTRVGPIGYSAPLGGMHATVIGALPPAAVGNAYVTVIARPLADAIVWAAGHVSAIAGGIVGAAGLEPQWTAQTAPRTTAAKRHPDGGEGTLQETRYGSMHAE